MTGDRAMGRPGRVALLVGRASGGMGAHVRMLAEGLAARGVAVSLFAPASTGADLGLTSLRGAEFGAVDFGDRPRAGDLASIRRLRRLLRGAGAPDVVHAHGMRAGALAALARAGRAHTQGLVVTVHNAPPETGRAARLIYLALERVVARKSDLVLCVSSDLEKRLRAKGARHVDRALVPAPDRPMPEVPAQACPRPDHPVPGSPAPAPEASQVPAPERPVAVLPERPLILAVGRLAPQKGFATLLDAAKAWQDRTPRPRLVIAGDGPLREHLTRKAAADGVDAEFPGHVPGILDLLARANVFVMPSQWEGQPLALQEALQAGAPIVASDVGGIPDLTSGTGGGRTGDTEGDTEGDTGGGLTRDRAAILVEPGNPAELGRAVLAVLDDEALAARLRAAARDRARTLPTREDAVTAALAAYRRVLL